MRVWAAVIALGLMSFDGRGEEGRPNVLVLLADDLGWKDIGCYGGPVRTPVLDRLAESGVRFTDFYSGAAVCSPSRATLLTGRQHVRPGIYSWISDDFQRSHLPVEELTIAEVLKGAGYATAHFGKWHLGMPKRGIEKPTPGKHGFDYWFATGNNAQPSHRNPRNFVRNGEAVGEIEGYSCQIVVNEAISWLEGREDSDAPFFLNVWFHEPHAPIAAPGGIVDGYGGRNDPGAIYSGTIENTDRAIGRLLEKLEEGGELSNTVIVYSSDNGSYREDRVGELRGKKGSNYEGGIRVPGVFSWPGRIEGGRVESEPAGLIDLLPTICGLVGIGKPSGVHLDGADLSGLLLGEGFRREQPLLWILPGAAPSAAIRDGRYSLVGFRDFEFPRNRELLDGLLAKIEATLKKNGTWELELRGRPFLAQVYEGFKDREAEKIRGEFIRLNMFQESWIPLIRKGGYRRFELYDLVDDPGQTTELSEERAEVFERMKEALWGVHREVMREAVDWSQP